MFAPWRRYALALTAQAATSEGAPFFPVEALPIGLLRARDRRGRASGVVVGHRHTRGSGRRLQIESVVQQPREPYARLFDLDGYDIACSRIIASGQRYRRSVPITAGGRAERVGGRFCEREGFARPVARRASAPGRDLRGRYFLTQGRGERLGIGCDLPNDDGVLIAMEVDRSRGAQCDADTVAAAILMIGSVQRLVHISDEVEHELEREAALRVGRGGIAEFAGELFDLGDHAILRRPLAGEALTRWKAEACGIEAASLQFDVGEVPRCGEAVGSAPHIRPGGARRHIGRSQRVVVAREDDIDPLTGSRGQVAPGDARDRFMPFVSPGIGGHWGAERKKKGSRETVHAAALPCRPPGEKMRDAAALA